VAAGSEEEIAAYDREIADLVDASDVVGLDRLAWALLSKGVVLERLGRTKEALTTFEEVASRLDQQPEPELRVRLATALSYATHALRDLKRPDETLRTCEAFLDRFGEERGAPFDGHVSFVTVQKGLALTALGRN
jgi:tetratricopeptide (TPR) repeat protein